MVMNITVLGIGCGHNDEASSFFGPWLPFFECVGAVVARIEQSYLGAKSAARLSDPFAPGNTCEMAMALKLRLHCLGFGSRRVAFLYKSLPPSPNLHRFSCKSCCVAVMSRIQIFWIICLGRQPPFFACFAAIRFRIFLPSPMGV